jgi:hypothetical protein
LKRSQEKNCVRSKFVVERFEQRFFFTICSFIRTDEAMVRGTDRKKFLCARIAQSWTSKNGVSLLGLLRREMSILLIRDISAIYMIFAPETSVLANSTDVSPIIEFWDSKVSIYFESSAIEIHRIYGFPGTRLSGTRGTANVGQGLVMYTGWDVCCSRDSSNPPPGEISNIRIMYNDIEHSISIDFYIYFSIFQVF